jgi:histone-lysine N-methyltransferase SETMAR
MDCEAAEELKEVKFDILPHPPYSPDLAPPDFHMFGRLKDTLRGRKFRDDTNTQNAVHN